ncbi:UDP-N-acetylmuramoyl-L-alanine--D-glutamate ligase [Candidatus Halobeggiatoa sp. HSG11]|nr:UDP-N-acetylmuramoyl-L-alanine--D-glutamate ligase [Candidatus Halobeggiatoa sp. HSG11]
MQSTSKPVVIMGMGKTGLACANFLINQDIPIIIMDNRDSPPGLSILQQKFPTIQYITGKFDSEILSQASKIIISPGLSKQQPALAKAQEIGIPIISEIELFANYVNAPVVAITGSNGKSTVTTLLGEMAQKAGWKAQVGGNLGTPAIELLCTPAPDLYILELSSFQLETTYSLNPAAAVVLNISADHMDRYASLSEYVTTKHSIYQGDGKFIINADDPYAIKNLHLSFSLQTDKGDFRICNKNNELHLAKMKNDKLIPLLPVTEMYLQGSIMQANALAALALGHAVGLPLTAMLEALKTFKGLPHRCAWVANKHGVDFFNDSKGTNVGATIAAIQGLARKSILIAGGDGKGADFSPLQDTVKKYCHAVVLIGQDAPLLAQVLSVPTYYASSLETAVQKAATLANSGDAVLLSPACASFDMFNNYEHRGQVFEDAVHKLNDNQQV